MDWTTRGRLLGCAILATSFISANATMSAGPARAGTGTGDPIIEYSDAHAAMNAAQAEARGHLDRFLAFVLDGDGSPVRDAGVKVAMPLKDGGDEIIWVAPFGIRDGQFIGILANDPVGLDGLAAGDAVTFGQAQVRDWFVYGDDGRMYGSYTTRVMLPDMTPQTAAQISEILSENPIPASW